MVVYYDVIKRSCTFGGGLVLLLLLTRCTGITSIAYTIPEDYEGFLVIHYECPSGTASRQADGRVHVTFNTDGVACIEESYTQIFHSGVFHVTQIFHSGVFHVTQITTPSGQEVPFAGNNLQHPAGYALVDLSLRQIKYGGTATAPTEVYGILWVGELAHLQQLADEREYTDAMATFFEEQLGVPRNPSRPPQFRDSSSEDP